MNLMSDEFIIDVLRELITRRGFKLPSLAKDLGITYRTLQSYIYKRTRMPIGVYLELCGRLGIPADYPLRERFGLDFEALRAAVDSTFGPLLDRIQVSNDLQLSLVDGDAKGQARTVIAHLLQSHYDRISQTRLDKAREEDE